MHAVVIISTVCILQNSLLYCGDSDVGCDGVSCRLLISMGIGGGSRWKCGSSDGPELSRVSATVSTCSASLSASVIQKVCLLGTKIGGTLIVTMGAFDPV